MLKKAFLATSALVVASSMALAGQHHGALPHGQTQAMVKQLIRDAMSKKNPGIVFNQKGLAVGTRVAIGSKTGTGHQSKLIPGGQFSNFGKSPNARFISWFGWYGAHASGVSGPYSYSYCLNSTCSNIEHVKYSYQYNYTKSGAQPFKGVAAASAISLGAEAYFSGGNGVVALYTGHKSTSASPCGTNSYSKASSCPGNPVAGASGTITAPSTFLCCSGLETINFAPVSLKKKKTYWVVLTGNTSGNNVLIWNGQASNWSVFPTGEDFRDVGSTKYHESYYSTAGGSGTFTTTFTSNTGGWIHVTPFSYGEQAGAFSVN